MQKEFTGIIYGALKSKANSRRVTRTGRYIKSAGALEFTNSAIIQLQAIKGRREPIKGDVGLECLVYYPSKRNDLDIQLFMDCLEKAGLLENDRQIIEYQAKKNWDKENPRVQFTLYSLEQD